MCCANGQGVPQDHATAVEWFRKAAEQDDDSAQYNLGVCYYNGLGVDKDEQMGIQLMSRAARKGNQSAQDTLRSLGLTW